MPNPQPTVSYTAQNVILYIADPTSLGSVLPVVALNGFQGLGGVKSSIKLSNFDSAGYEEYAPGLVDPGKPSGTVILNYKDSSHQLLQKLLGMGAPGATSFMFAEADTTQVPTAPGGVMTAPVGTVVATPGTVTPTPTAGGSLVAAAYFYKVTALNAAGETLASAEATASTSGGNLSMALAWTTVAGAASYNVYRSNVTTAETLLANTATNSYLDVGPYFAGTVVPPVANSTAGFSRSGWIFNGFVAEFGYQTSVNNVAMCKLTIQATGARKMIVRGLAAAI